MTGHGVTEKNRLKILRVFVAPWLVAVAVAAAAATQKNIPYSDAKPILDALRVDLLPAELRGQSAAALESTWPAWVARRDAEIRARVERGDEDSVVTLLLFGVTFTSQPRYSFAAWASGRAPQGRPEDVVADDPIVKARIADMVRGISMPGSSERLQFARRVVGRRGIEPARFLVDALKRMLREYDEYFTQAAPGATLFRNRGLSSDTSIYAAFAIDRTLSDLASQGLLPAGSIRRAAVIGPGLDFADKQEGVDFYPVQTIQAFALIDSLRRLQLAGPGDLHVTTYDLSPQVNQHIEGALRQAEAGRAYTLQLARDSTQPWQKDLLAYWQRAGDRIGEAAPPIVPPRGQDHVRMRAVRIRPDVVRTITTQDMNIVLQRPELPDDQRFDLVIATNILIYYDVFEQSLALGNITRMLRPGGLLLTNTPLFELPGIPIHAVGGTKAIYMTGASDGVIWYRRE